MLFSESAKTIGLIGLGGSGRLIILVRGLDVRNDTCREVWRWAAAWFPTSEREVKADGDTNFIAPCVD